MDVQHCDFDLISYAFTTKDIVYEWDTSGEPVQKKAGVGTDLPNFNLEDINTGIECTSHTNTGKILEKEIFLSLPRQYSNPQAPRGAASNPPPGV